MTGVSGVVQRMDGWMDGWTDVKSVPARTRLALGFWSFEFSLVGVRVGGRAMVTNIGILSWCGWGVGMGEG